MGKFILGFITAIVVIVIAGFLVIAFGLMPTRQDIKPGAIETWVAKTSLRATIKRETAGLAATMPPSEPNLTAGAKLYADNCQPCHGGPNGQASPIAKGLAPDPPQLAKDGVEDDPEGVTYWTIAHGIRFTGMPGFIGSLSDPQIWQLALFLKHMDKLPPQTQQAWAAASARR
ncbi:MAG TPA: cytochrome c [Thermoanaerobaculia bacterium]|nr:cytochrome c [Thermoanaerobaculia bacterium]